jgi:hypothetical protein
MFCFAFRFNTVPAGLICQLPEKSSYGSRNSYARFTVFFLILAILTSCVDPYEPEVYRSDKRLVVEGRITSLPGPYTVRISYSARYSKDVYGIEEYITGAYVSINSTDGESEVLKEVSRGTYVSSTKGIRGEFGKSYYVDIITPDGEAYHSEPELMLDPPPLNKIYYEYNPGDFMHQEGFEVYGDIDDPADENNYYKWETAGWYQWSSDCWKKIHNSARFNLKSDEDFNGKTWRSQYMVTAPYNSALPYVVDVYQMALSASAFTFLANLEKQVSVTGSIFDPPPGFLNGNIYNTGHPEKIALGYFYVAGVSEAGIAIDRSNVGKNPDIFIGLQPDAVYCGDPCDYNCVAFGGGKCGVKPCPPECNSLPDITYIPPREWPFPYKRCDE